MAPLLIPEEDLLYMLEIERIARDARGGGEGW